MTVKITRPKTFFCRTQKTAIGHGADFGGTGERIDSTD